MKPVVTYKVKDGQVFALNTEGWVLNLDGVRYMVDRRWTGTVDALEKLKAQNRDVDFQEVKE